MKFSETNTDKNKEKKEKPTPMEVALSVVKATIHTDIKTDPQGSWTGVPEDKHDRPVQDADDL